MMPKAGGQYVYLREAYSPFWGFLYGWTLFLVIQTATIAAVAVAFGRYTRHSHPVDIGDELSHRADPPRAVELRVIALDRSACRRS